MQLNVGLKGTCTCSLNVSREIDLVGWQMMKKGEFMDSQVLSRLNHQSYIEFHLIPPIRYFNEYHNCVQYPSCQN